jgi:hypothetical protein
MTSSLLATGFGNPDGRGSLSSRAEASRALPTQRSIANGAKIKTS